MKYTDDTLTAGLDLELPENDAGASTVRHYLWCLLHAVWTEEEGFNGKRPFGNSGWQHEVTGPLIEAHLCEPDEADEFVQELIAFALDMELVEDEASE